MNVFIIGNFGYKSNNIGGQTIKTRNLLELYQNNYIKGKVDFIDIDKFSFFTVILIFYKILFNHKILLVPGQKFLKTLFIPIMFFSVLLRKQIILFAVGGWLNEFLSNKPLILKYVFKVNKLYVESKALKNDLESDLNLNAIEVFPNFRVHNFKKVNIKSNKTFNIVFMARITKTKGCNLLFDFIEKFNKNNVDNNLFLQFYGPIDPIYSMEFNSKINRYPNVSYNGIVEPQDVYRVLSSNDICVLPTYHEGEGFPGTIVDSYIAGIPVIISRWKNLPEFVDDNKTGIIFDLEDENGLYNAIVSVYDNEQLLREMKINALHKSLQYSEEEAWKILNYFNET